MCNDNLKDSIMIMNYNVNQISTINYFYFIKILIIFIIITTSHPLFLSIK